MKQPIGNDPMNSTWAWVIVILGTAILDSAMMWLLRGGHL